MATLAPFYNQQFFTDAGAPVALGYLYTYVSGTTTDKATYQDQAQSTPNTNPIALDAAGRIPVAMWLGTGEYTFVLKTNALATIKSWDDVGGSENETFRSLLDFIPNAQHSAIKDFTSTYDCSAALQDALDTQEPIEAPRGLFLLDATSEFTYTGGHIKGVGYSFYGTRFKRASDTSFGPLLLSAGGAVSEATIIEGIYFQDANGVASTNTSAMLEIGCNDWTLRSCWIKNGKIGLYLPQASSNGHIEGNIFEACRKQGLDTYSAGLLKIVGNTFYKCTADYSAPADRSAAITLRKDAGYSFGTSDVNFVGNYFYETVYGHHVWLEGVEGIQFSGNFFSIASQVDPGQRDDIYMKDATRVEIAGNTSNSFLNSYTTGYPNQRGSRYVVNIDTGCSDIAIGINGFRAGMTGTINDPNGAATIVGNPGVASVLRDGISTPYAVSVAEFMTSAQVTDVLSNTGSLDVSAAVQAAINTVKTVEFLPGTYKINTKLTGVTQQTLRGSKRAKTIFKAGASIDAILSYPSGAYSGVTIENILFNGNALATRGIELIGSSQGAVDQIIFRDVGASLSTGAQVYLENMTYGELDHLLCNGGTYGLHLKNCYTSLIKSGVFYNGSTASYFLEGCSDVESYQVTTFNSGTNSTSVAKIDGGHANIFRRCTFEPQGTANVTQEVLINDTVTGTCTDHVFEDCEFIGAADTKTRSMVVGSSGQINKLRIDRCRFLKPTGNESILLTSQAGAEIFRSCDIVTYDTGTFAPVTILNNSGNSYYTFSARGRVTVTYSASMTFDMTLGDTFTITVTNGTAFTINAPTTPNLGQRLKLTIRNTSGGAVGVITWNAAFKMAAWTSPATANSRAIEFEYDGTNWIESNRSAADIPN